MSVDILGTSCDQCRSMVQYSLTSTETRRLVRKDSPGRPPRLSHSSWTMTLSALLMIAYIALFSALEQTHCTRMWFYMSDKIARFLFCFCFLNIHQSGVLTALAWLLPHETAAVSAQILCTPYNRAPCHFMQSHIRKVYACFSSCNLPPALLAEWPGSFTAVTRGGTDSEIRVSTESWHWRRNFSRRSPAAGIRTRDLLVTSLAL